jgi:hypothetical protein
MDRRATYDAVQYSTTGGHDTLAEFPASDTRRKLLTGTKSDPNVLLNPASDILFENV